MLFIFNTIQIYLQDHMNHWNEDLWIFKMWDIHMYKHIVIKMQMKLIQKAFGKYHNQNLE